MSDPNTNWHFNEAVSLLREARQYVPDATGLAEEIDESLPQIQAALELAVRSPETTTGSR